MGAETRKEQSTFLEIVCPLDEKGKNSMTYFITPDAAEFIGFGRCAGLDFTPKWLYVSYNLLCKINERIEESGIEMKELRKRGNLIYFLYVPKTASERVILDKGIQNLMTSDFTAKEIERIDNFPDFKEMWYD